MAKIASYKELVAWQKAMTMAETSFKLTAKLPRDVRFELTNQIHRAAVSVPTNIAEGFNRHSRPAYLDHLRIALGSLAELQTQLELSARLGLLERTAVQAVDVIFDDVGRLLHGLTRSLERSS